MEKALEILKRLQNSDYYDRGKLKLPKEYTLDKAIEELEEAMKPKTCEGCKYGQERYWDWDSGRYDKNVSFECIRLDKSGQLTPYSKYEEKKFYCSPDFCCNRYEPKDNA